jgi:hypothetical protein
MKSKMAAAGVAFALAAAVLGLAAGPASAASGPRTTATIERLPGSAVPWAGAAGPPRPRHLRCGAEVADLHRGGPPGLVRGLRRCSHRL